MAKSNAYYGEGNVPIHLDSVQCSGLENTLTECDTGLNETSTNHSLDVGVKCQPGIRSNSYCYTLVLAFLSLLSAPGSFREGDVRLVEGSYNWKGCVEILLSGLWGGINDSSWTDEDANVICRQLQFSSGNSELSIFGKFHNQLLCRLNG